MIRQTSSRVDRLVALHRARRRRAVAASPASRRRRPAGSRRPPRCGRRAAAARSASAVVPCSRPCTTSAAPECSSTYCASGGGEPGVDRHPDRPELAAGVERLQRGRVVGAEPGDPVTAPRRRGRPAPRRPGGPAARTRRASSSSPSNHRAGLSRGDPQPALGPRAQARRSSPQPQGADRVLLHDQRPDLGLDVQRLEVGDPALGAQQRVVRAEEHLALEQAVGGLDQLRREVLRRPARTGRCRRWPCAWRSRSRRPARAPTGAP